MNTVEQTVPPDFLSETTLSAVPSAQSKFLARLIDGKYVLGSTEAEVHERYLMCQDLAEQLIAYCQHRRIFGCTN